MMMTGFRRQPVGAVRLCACGAPAVAVVAVSYGRTGAVDVATPWCRGHLNALDVPHALRLLQRTNAGVTIAVRPV